MRSSPGVGVVGVLYMATNAATQYILPAARIADSSRPAVLAMSVVSGHWGASLVSAAMALSILVGLNGTTMSGARVPFAAARDRLFPARMAHIHPRFQSPSTALVVQGLLSTLLLLLVGRFQQLFELAIFAEWLFYLLTATTIFVYRRRIPAAERPFRFGDIRFCRRSSLWRPRCCSTTPSPAMCAARWWEHLSSSPAYRCISTSALRTEGQFKPEAFAKG